MIRGVSEKILLGIVQLLLQILTLQKDRQRISVLLLCRECIPLTPDATTNLDMFSASFKRFGIYLLAPAIIDGTQPQPRVLFDVGIVKTSFNDREAWEIGPNDLDMAGINDETMPIIPKDKKDAPVLELLKKKIGIILAAGNKGVCRSFKTAKVFNTRTGWWGKCCTLKSSAFEF